MKILITGHKGLIGEALYKTFASEDVHGFDRGDAFPDERFDLIIHTAANCVIRSTIKKPSLAKENIDITYRVFELARKFRPRLLLFSSGRLSHEVYNPYTVSKRYLEDMAKAYKDCYDLDSLVIRPETVWGKSLNNERVVIKWLEAALANKPLLIYGEPDKELPPIYIDDFIGMTLSLMRDYDMFKNRTFVISGQVRKAVDIANAIITLTNSSSEIEYRVPELTQPQTCEPANFQSPVPFELSMEKYIKNNKLI